MPEESKNFGTARALADTPEGPVFARAYSGGFKGGLIGGLIGALMTLIVCLICRFVFGM